MTHTLEAIAWTLIHFCWQAAAVAAVYRLLSFALARRTSQTHYLLALSAMLLMLAASIATFAWEIRTGAASSTSSITASVTEISNTTVNFSRGMAHVSGGAYPASSEPSLTAALPWIDGLWVLGVILLSLRSLGGWWLIQRLRASASADAPAAVHAGFQRVAAALGLRRPVLLRVSCIIAGPVTVGVLRAMVLLPFSAVTSLGPDELEVVLAHELAHIRRADFFWNLLQTLVETLFFFHPAVWWINARIRHERELCCDDLALKVCPNSVVYAQALLRLEELRFRQLKLAMALDGHQSPQTLRMRIARVLGEPVASVASRPVQPFSLALAFVVLAGLLLPTPNVLASFSPAHPATLVPAEIVNRASMRISSPAPSASAVRPTLAPAYRRLAVPAPRPLLAVTAAAEQEKSAESSGPETSYIDEMKTAGYDIDLDKLTFMKAKGVTPEYARAMGELGLGKPNVNMLIACKMQGITPEYIAQLKQQGLEVESFQQAFSYRIFQVTPKFVASVKATGASFVGLTDKQLLSLRLFKVGPDYIHSITALGYDQPTVGQLIALKARGFDPAEVREIRSLGYQPTLDEVIELQTYHVTPDFIRRMQARGFKDLTIAKVVQMRKFNLVE